MKQIEDGIDILARPWKGRCHCCSAEFESTGEEIKRLKPGDQHGNITTVNCNACGAPGKVYLEPVYVRSKKDQRRIEEAQEMNRKWALEETIASSVETIITRFDHATGAITQETHR